MKEMIFPFVIQMMPAFVKSAAKLVQLGLSNPTSND